MMTLRYGLNELPSSQHRAGLAGLVLAIEWLQRQPGRRKGVARVASLERAGASIELDEEGLKELFDGIYAASREEVADTKLRKNKAGQVVEPLRQETRSEVDARGKPKEKHYYYYPLVVPRGGPLLELDPTAQGEKGLWIKLWRDAVWAVLRGVPAQRRPYEARAVGEGTTDASDAWHSLRSPEKSEQLSSTYFLGSQATTADNVSMQDRNRLMFLLHFWPFAVSIYVPNAINNKGEREFHGFAIAFPDIADLKTYVQELPETLRLRGVEAAGYRPRGCLVDLVNEVGLDVLQQLRARLEVRVGRSAIHDVVYGVDVVHLAKEGNNVRLLASLRVDPGPIVDAYERVRGRYWDIRFRQTRLRALVQGRPWLSGFDRLLTTTDYEQTFSRGYFRRDAREAFKLEVNIMTEDNNETDDEKTPRTPEEIVFRVVKGYLGGKLKRRDLDWKKVKGTSSEEDYRKTREKLAKDAFLAIRSRTGGDFIEYFAGTLCSVPQKIKESDFRILTEALHTSTDQIRTLTLLALSAQA